MNGVTIEKLDAFTDARGWSVHPVDYTRLRAGEIDNIHVVSMAPGSLRGNHYHKAQTEDFFIAGGPCMLLFRNIASGEQEEFTVAPDSLQRIRVAPGIAHVIVNASDATAYLVCSSDHRFSTEDPDTFREVLVP
jgi:dTDP-4-dehydrorhamnose 3,5-epimerase-like enzyme